MIYQQQYACLHALEYIQLYALPENVKLDQNNDDDSDIEISDQGSLPSDNENEDEDEVPGAVDI